MQNTKRALFVALMFATTLPLAACSSHSEQDQQETAADQTTQPDAAAQQQAATAQQALDDAQAKMPHNAQEQNGGARQTPAEMPGPQNNYEVKTFFSDYKQYSIGDIVPDLYRTKPYNISDYKIRKLPAPQPGSHWTYMGGNYVLITDAEGKILQAKSGEIFYRS